MYVGIILREPLLLGTPGNNYLIELQWFPQPFNNHLLSMSIDRAHLTSDDVSVCTVKVVVLDEESLILAQWADVALHVVQILKGTL